MVRALQKIKTVRFVAALEQQTGTVSVGGDLNKESAMEGHSMHKDQLG